MTTPSKIAASNRRYAAAVEFSLNIHVNGGCAVINGTQLNGKIVSIEEVGIDESGEDVVFFSEEEKNAFVLLHKGKIQKCLTNALKNP